MLYSIVSEGRARIHDSSLSTHAFRCLGGLDGRTLCRGPVLLYKLTLSFMNAIGMKLKYRLSFIADLEMFVNGEMGWLTPISGRDADVGDWTHRAFIPAQLPALDNTARQLPNPQLLRQPALQRDAQSTRGDERCGKIHQYPHPIC